MLDILSLKFHFVEPQRIYYLAYLWAHPYSVIRIRLANKFQKHLKKKNNLERLACGKSFCFPRGKTAPKEKLVLQSL